MSKMDSNKRRTNNKKKRDCKFVAPNERKLFIYNFHLHIESKKESDKKLLWFILMVILLINMCFLFSKCNNQVQWVELSDQFSALLYKIIIYLISE